MKYTLLIFLAISMLTLNSCQPKYEMPEVTAGETVPSKFVMIGGTFSSGYTDDALYFEGQQNSIGYYISQSLNNAGLSLFNQPLVSEGSVGLSTTGLSRLILGYKTDCLNITSLSPVRETTMGDASILNTIYSGIPYNNMGIPGLRLTDLSNSSYANENPYYSRMASSAGATVLSDITSVNASLFSVFIGLDDFMPYIKSGAKEDSLPHLTVFENAYRELIYAMTLNGAKGVISTIPDPTSSPYFTTIPWNGLTLDSANNATLNNIYNPLGFYFEIGSNPFMIEDPAANNIFGVRPMVEEELMLLSVPLDSVKCHKMGTLYPLRNEFILTNSELDEIRTRISEVNSIIRSIASEFNLALVEADVFFADLESGFAYNGINMGPAFISGGAYGLDGLRFNARTNALFANQFIRAINNKYNATFPEVNASNLDSAFFP